MKEKEASEAAKRARATLSPGRASAIAGLAMSLEVALSMMVARRMMLRILILINVNKIYECMGRRGPCMKSLAEPASYAAFSCFLLTCVVRAQGPHEGA